MVDLISLLPSRNLNDFESDTAFFRTHTPHRAPFAYFHIIFKPAVPEVQSRTSQQLRLPQDLREFYARQNGAELFGGMIRIFGLLPDKHLLNRVDWRNLPPLNLVGINQDYGDELMKRDLIVFADYAVDASSVCLERSTGWVRCFRERRFDSERKRWKGLAVWITGEIERLSPHFDELGRCVTEEEELVPW